MSVLIVGSTALDSIKTPGREHPRLLGGSASHAAVAASFFSPARMVGVVGADFPRRYIQLYERHGIDLAGLQRLPGKTFHWSGEYEANMNNRRTLLTELGVFEQFNPVLPEHYRRCKFLFLFRVNFKNIDFPIIFRSKFLQYGGNHFARSTPICIKIYHTRFVSLKFPFFIFFEIKYLF